MKKLFLFLFSAALFLQFSCSSNSEPEISESSSSGGIESSSSNGDVSSSSNDNLSSSSSYDAYSSSEGNTEPCLEANGPVACYGKLKVVGSKLTGSKTGNREVQLRGVSLGWSNTGWESADFFNAETVDAMVDHWKAEIIRVPMGHGVTGHDRDSERAGSYVTDKIENMARVKTVIDRAIERNVYVIIDWHSHFANLDMPNSRDFFEEMAGTYGNNDHVIFEIFNEPIDISWDEIKSYAEEIVPIIRQYSSNLILVGTRFYSRYINEVIDNEPECSDCENLAYVLHFYAQGHSLNRYISREGEDPSFKEAIEAAINAGIHIFISEYGTVNSNGGTGEQYESHHEEHSDEWHNFLDEKKISSVAWNVNHKNEGSAFFSQGQNINRGFDFISWNDPNKMSLSGVYIFNKLRAYAETAEWRGKL